MNSEVFVQVGTGSVGRVMDSRQLEMQRTAVSLRALRGCLSKPGVEGRGKEGKQSQKMGILWWNHLMNQGIDLLTEDACHKGLNQYLSDAALGVCLL